MTSPELFHSLGWMVAGSALLVLLTRPLHIPTLVIYIMTGLLLGPVAGLVEVDEVLHIIAEVGIALLLFLVGLELSLDRIRDVGRVAFVAGIGQVLFTALGGMGLCWLLGFNVIESIFLATALTFSSTVVVVKLLDQKKELHSLYGRIAVGIFLVQDLVVIVALTFLGGLGKPESLEPGQLAAGVGRAFGGMALLLSAALVASRYLLPGPAAWLARSTEAVFVAALCWCFVLVAVAEALHLSPEIGAFLAGLSLAQLPFGSSLRRRVHPLMNFFIVVFFVTLGVQMELGPALGHAWPAVVLSLFVLIGNPFIFMILILACRFDERTAFMTSVTVAQISEFSFVFAAMGLSAGLIDRSILSLTALVGLVTIAASSYMILYNERLYEICRRLGLLRIFRGRQAEPQAPEPPLADHVVVVGMNPLSEYLLEGLARRGHRLVAVDTDHRKLQGLDCATVLGNVEDSGMLDELHLADAKLVISALRIEDTNKLLAYRSKQLGTACAIHAFDQSVVEDLERLGVDYLIDSKASGRSRVLAILRDSDRLPP